MHTRVAPPQGSRDPSSPFTSPSSQPLYREDSMTHIEPQGPYSQPYPNLQRLRNQSTSYSDRHPPTMMPTPQIYDPDSSPTSSLHSGYFDPAPAYGSGLGTSPPHNYSPSMRSFRSTEVAPTDDNHFPPSPQDDLPNRLSNLSLSSYEGLRRFQAGDLPDEAQEWHRLSSPEAREALGHREVQRQCALFEIFKSERDYVADLLALEEIYIRPLRTADTPIIPPERLNDFTGEVFHNVYDILRYHSRMLESLFARQREEHPVVQSISDIILATTMAFSDTYESYIKHYPISDSRHRSEIKRNWRYQMFTQQASLDPRVRKRDLVTFLSRPVTRLPRLRLLLEALYKLTDPGHPDKENLPLILDVLGDLIRRTQPGIEAAESKVKVWGLCEDLTFVPGEIIDMDLFDKNRTLLHSGDLARKQRSDTVSHWSDLFVALLDNYFIMTKRQASSSGGSKLHVVSRPIPLDFLRLDTFDAPAETRRERDGGILDLRGHSWLVYPFTVYHAAAKATRRYTLYCTSEAARKKWYDLLTHALAVHKAAQDSNMWFVQNTLNENYFSVMPPNTQYRPGVICTGRVTCATPFIAGPGKRFLAIGCSTGVFVAPQGDPRFRKLLSKSNPTSMTALQPFNKFVAQFDASIYTWSLDLLARVYTGHAIPRLLEASMETIVDGNAIFFRTATLGERLLLIYATKGRLHATLHHDECMRPSDVSSNPSRSNHKVRSFRQFGQPFSVPRDVHNVTPLVKTIAIQGERNITIVDPTNSAKSAVVSVPDLSNAPASAAVTALKARIDDARPLGLTRSGETEFLVIYDAFGCYITKHGPPSRNAGYIRWETKATSYAQHGAHILLFSEHSIEVRHIPTGRFVQVILGEDMRLLYEPRGPHDKILIAARGAPDKQNGGWYEKIVELIETREIPSTPEPSSAGPRSAVPWMWDERHMHDRLPVDGGGGGLGRILSIR